MARAKRHYIPGQIWHITQRCHKGEFLLRFKWDRYRWIQWLLNMVRAGVVSHPSQWLHGGYVEIQAPRRKSIIVAYDRLRELAGFRDYPSFSRAHRRWVAAKLRTDRVKREAR